jgi:hypothetical protein
MKGAAHWYGKWIVIAYGRHTIGGNGSLLSGLNELSAGHGDTSSDLLYYHRTFPSTFSVDFGSSGTAVLYQSCRAFSACVARKRH